jgi:hypothetical protein
MSKQPEALRLAVALESGDVYESHSAPVYGWCENDHCDEAAAELRRLHAVNAELLAALRAMLGDDDHDEAKNKARAAIERATGEAQ